MKLVDQLKAVSRVPEGQVCALRKSTVLDIIRALRALEEIADMPIGRNPNAEATRMRELAQNAINPYTL